MSRRAAIILTIVLLALVAGGIFVPNAQALLAIAAIIIIVVGVRVGLDTSHTRYRHF